MATRKRRHRSIDETRALLADARARGLTQSALAKELQVHTNTVGYWIRRERDLQDRSARPDSPKRQRPHTATLIPVRVVEPRIPRRPASAIEVVLPRARDGRRVLVRVPRGVAAVDLQTVLDVLGGGTC